MLGLPAPFSTLPGVLVRLSTTSKLSILTASDDPRHLPLALTLASIPTCYVLGLLSGNVGWVDRIYTTWPLLCSGSVIAWAFVNDAGAVYGACLPRLALVVLLQVIWSVRLTWHTARRGLYHPFSEDYRYQVLRKLMPHAAFELLHFFLVVIPQPLLIFALGTFPVAALLQSPAQLSPGPVPNLYLPYSVVADFIPSRFAAPSPNTPVLNATDGLLTALCLLAIVVEAAADNAMYAFQTAKHTLMEHHPVPDIANAKESASASGVPAAVSVPAAYYPGFPTRGLHAVSRHPNFASEQSFWLFQGLFSIACSTQPSLIAALGPAFSLSLLFGGSTRLTEWITTCKYPVYTEYSQLVGMFLPHETLLKWAWTSLCGTRAALVESVYNRASQLFCAAAEAGSPTILTAAGGSDPAALAHSNLSAADLDRLKAFAKHK